MTGRWTALLFAVLPVLVTAQEVRVEVLLHDDGQPVRLRDPSALELIVDGRPQDFEIAEAEPLSVAAVVDLSSSVNPSLLAAVTAGLESFFSGLGETDRCAVIPFQRTVELHGGWEQACSEAVAALAGLRSGGPSALNGALTLALGLLAEAPGRPVLLLFTDGVDGASWARDLWPMVGLAGVSPLVFSVTAPAVLSRGGRMGGVYGSVNAEDFARQIRFEGRHVTSGDVVVRGLRNVDPFWVLEEMGRRTGGALVRTGGEPSEVEEALAGLSGEIAFRTSLRFLPEPALGPGTHEIVVESPEGEVRHRAAFVLPQ